jgi:hypothetical protein
MPLVLLFVCIGLIALLMVVGWRRRWDPTPQTLEPVTLRSARATAGPPTPRWYWWSFGASLAVVVLGPAFATLFHRRWISVVALVLFGLVWAARHAALLWTRAESPVKRVAAVLRPGSLLLGAFIGVLTYSAWWILPTAVVYVAVLPIADAIERRRDRSVPASR